MKLWPRKQTSQCAGCARPITERRRRPCRFCGSLGRIVSMSLVDAVKADLTL